MERKPFKKVTRHPHSWIAGVCGGLAYSLGIPVLYVRIGAIVALCIFTNGFFDYLGSFVFWGYIIAWIFAPRWAEDPADFEKRTT